MIFSLLLRLVYFNYLVAPFYISPWLHVPDSKTPNPPYTPSPTVALYTVIPSPTVALYSILVPGSPPQFPFKEKNSIEPLRRIH